jgi:hypothetical protein
MQNLHGHVQQLVQIHPAEGEFAEGTLLLGLVFGLPSNRKSNMSELVLRGKKPKKPIPEPCKVKSIPQIFPLQDVKLNCSTISNFFMYK